MTIQLKDIAKQLNVSVSTVSKTINGTGRVGKETRERILAAIKESGYQPNEVARSLKRKSTRSLGVIVADISNSFYAKVIKGVEKVASANDYNVFVCNTDEKIGKEEEYVRVLLQNQVSGLVIATVGGDPKLFQPYINSGIPFVFIDNLPDTDDNFDLVTIDNVKASYTIAQHLVDQGHRKLALITGPLNQSTASERKKGFQKCLEDNGIPLQDEWIGVGEFKNESGYQIMTEWLKRDERPSALVAANDFLLYGAIKAIYEEGLRIPQDIAVACFDATDETGLLRPRITSIIQPAFEIGSIAAEIIMRKERNKERKLFEKIVLEPTLLMNESSLGVSGI
ncbi:LacI family transcriptional regulator [Paenibacillus baekrokdamisoli]|uniref:LacI family transcriptional regulator n=1 Tax=Paenibacillus baekrokdamisoli TaxID=1712516 RepID=A0A3G9IZ49_9BACL|nr:LacI family DNA-binding transcriptional regulator [Paenibacillus baekrokdamisoli]MBB3068721.1 LacI family transcriptional regulator [Paenibacillus baekrokdamisoli]BBH23552.1 LacI family transcriptional regulator [Paenibacillus baekrokdamisoli]